MFFILCLKGLLGLEAVLRPELNGVLVGSFFNFIESPFKLSVVRRWLILVPFGVWVGLFSISMKSSLFPVVER